MNNDHARSVKNVSSHIARVLSILMILSLLTGGAVLKVAEPGGLYSYAAAQTEGDYEYTVSGDTVTLTAYNGTDAEPVIPASIGGRKVTAIGPECFRGNVRITRISIPEGITEIGDYAFEACSAATELSLPSTLQVIGKGAFSGDGMLTEIVIPDSVEKIDDGAFLYCMNAESITGGRGLTELGQFVFAGCEKAVSVDIGGPGLTAIPDRTFCNCTELTSVSLPDSVETVGKRAFSRCMKLKEISFGPGLRSVAEYAFEDCMDLTEVAFDENSTELELGSNAFNNDYGEGDLHIILPDNTVIREDTFNNVGITGLHVYGEGRLQGYDDLIVIDGQLYADDGAALIHACTDKYDTAAGEWVPATETFTDGTRTRTRFRVADGVLRIGPEAFSRKRIANIVLPGSIEEIDEKAFRDCVVQSVTFSDVNDRYFIEEGMLYEKAASEDTDGDASGDGGDAEKRRLVRFFPKKADGDTLSDTTVYIEKVDDEITETAKQYTLPDNVATIAPYAFYGSMIELVIPDSTSLEGFGDRSFANSGIEDPRSPGSGNDFGGTITVSDEVLSRLAIADNAFEDAWDYYVDFSDDEEDYMDQSGRDGGSDGEDGSGNGGGDVRPVGRDERPEDIEFNDRFARVDENGDITGFYDDDYKPSDPVITYTSLSGDKSLYSEEKYKDYKVIPNSEFPDWCDEYLEHNKDEIEFSQALMPYTMLYKGEAHYRSMVCVLNHDQFKTDYSIRNVGDDFAPMYLMMDHGLEAELRRGEVQEDLVLYSGITVEKMADIAGFSDKSVVPTVGQLIDAIGGDFTDAAFMSTTSDPLIAGAFSSHSETMVVIYASKESMRNLGAVCIDSFTGWGAGENEILFNLGAKFRILDVGTLTVDNGNGDVSYTRTYIRLELYTDEDAEDPGSEDEDSKEPDSNDGDRQPDSKDGDAGDGSSDSYSDGDNGSGNDGAAGQADKDGDDSSGRRPRTGDDGFGIYLTMMLVSAAALAAMLAARRKRS